MTVRTMQRMREAISPEEYPPVRYPALTALVRWAAEPVTLPKDVTREYYQREMMRQGRLWKLLCLSLRMMSHFHVSDGEIVRAAAKSSMVWDGARWFRAGRDTAPEVRRQLVVAILLSLQPPMATAKLRKQLQRLSILTEVYDGSAI